MIEETLILRDFRLTQKQLYLQPTVLKAKKQFMKDESPTRLTPKHRAQEAMEHVRESGEGAHSFNISTGRQWQVELC